MPYCRSTNQFVICPPKTGTLTVTATMLQLHKTCEMGSHISYAQACKMLKRVGVDPLSVKWAMTVRHPVDRFVSAINHFMNGNKNADLDDAMVEAVKGQRFMFQPQSDFWEDSVGIILFPFEKLPILEWLGRTKAHEKLHENEGSYLTSRKSIVEHPYFISAMTKYSDDWSLFNRVR